MLDDSTFSLGDDLVGDHQHIARSRSQGSRAVASTAGKIVARGHEADSEHGDDFEGHSPSIAVLKSGRRLRHP